MFAPLMTWIVALVPTTQAQVSTPSIDALQHSWANVQSVVQHSAVYPITLNEQDFVALSKGKVAKRRIRENGPDRALGVMWTPMKRAWVWVSILDDIHDNLVSSLSEQRLGLSKDGHKLLYQHINLPWPVQDRQLVVEIQNNETIARQTNGMLWERSWDLADPKLMSKPDPSAVWVPVANGSWLLLTVDGGTLVVYHTRSAIGGRIPDEMVTRWAMATLDEMMMHIADRAQQIPSHYQNNHEILTGGDGVEIDHFKRK